MHYGIYSVILILVFICLIVATLLTGHDKRDYQVLDPDQTVDIEQKKMLVSQLAELYKPRMFINSATPSPPLLWVWYEAIANENRYDIVYYHVWENEINPNRIIHYYYSLFRAFYFGYPLYDIEYFQVKINRNDGTIQGLRFETSPSDEYYQLIPDHIIVLINKIDSVKYREQRMSTKGNILSEKDDVNLQLEDTHVMVAAQTWNHVHCLRSNEKYDLYLDAPLKILTEEDYQKYKFSRKSQGDYRTRQKFGSKLIGNLSRFYFLIIPASILLLFSWLKKKKYAIK